MKAERAIRRIVLTLLLATAAGEAFADAVSSPPSNRAALAPIAAADLSPLTEENREAITTARARLADLLDAPSTPAGQLAAAYGELGALYQVNDLLASAQRAFDNARALEPSELRWVYYAGYLDLDSGQAEQALEHFDQAREIDADYAPLTLRRAQALLELSRLDEAGALYAQALATPGLAAAAHYGLGQIALLARRPGDAVGHFTRALELDPAASAVHYPLAQALRAIGRTDEAREHLPERGPSLPRVEDPLLDELEAHASPSLAQFRRGMLASRASDWAGAAEAFGAGLTLMPDNTNARISYARALYLGGERKAARTQLERVLAQTPEDGLARFLIAVLDDAAGEQESAMRGYREVIAREPEHAGANFYLGQAHLRSGSLEQAAQAFDAAIAADPANVPAYLYRDVALERLGRPDAERVTGLEAALKRAPDDALLRYRLARLLAVSGDAAVRDPGRALELAGALAAAQPMPQHIELLALARAANAEFEEAAELIEPLVSLAGFGPPGEAERLERSLAAYRSDTLPETGPDPSSAFLGRPARPDPTGPVRDYPAPKPF